jgi:mannose-1-phosphate guanylyltransferase
MDGAVIKAHSWVNNTIVGWNSQVGRWCRVTNVSVLGEDVQLSVCIWIA